MEGHQLRDPGEGNMLSRPIGRVLTVCALTCIAVLPATRALADDPWEPVNCSANPSAAGCDVSVGTPEKPGNVNHGNDSGDSSGGSGAGTDSTCHSVKVDNGPPPAGAAPKGGWYMQVCGSGGSVLGTAPQWIVDPPAAVDPAVVARQASASLDLPSPAIRANPDPGRDLLVQVPVWMWMDPASWGSRSATASVPGLSVTATAQPKQVRWDMGDGTTVICKGAGTPWRVGASPKAASPDCGHTYRRSSANSSGNRFSMRATVTWSVSWTGGGTNGTLPELTTSSAVSVRVAESQAINGGTP
jgi:hypothetical protein